MITLFANNAKTTLAAPITSTATSITVAPGTGALFPSPTTGQGFRVTLNSVSTPTLYEICICTARSGDTLTVIRGQEGTTASPFSLSDIIGNFDTAGTMADLVQSEQLQMGTYVYKDVGGTANALTATVNSNLTTIPDGLNLLLGSAYANTGPVTFTLTLGSTVQSTYPIVKGNNAALVAGDIPSAGYPIQVNWSPEFMAFVMQNPATGILVASVPTGAIMNFPATTAPSGFLVAGGQLVSRATYAALWTFAQASGNLVSDSTWTGGQYGSFSSGDGSTTFRLPQYGGYFLRSLDNGNGIDPSRAIGTVQQNQNQTHTHTATSVNTITDPGHFHSQNYRIVGAGVGGLPSADGTGTIYNTNPAVTGINVTTATTIAASGGSESRPVNISVLTCIKY